MEILSDIMSTSQSKINGKNKKTLPQFTARNDNRSPHLQPNVYIKKVLKSLLDLYLDMRKDESQRYNLDYHIKLDGAMDEVEYLLSLSFFDDSVFTYIEGRREALEDIEKLLADDLE